MNDLTKTNPTARTLNILEIYHEYYNLKNHNDPDNNPQNPRLQQKSYTTSMHTTQNPHISQTGPKSTLRAQCTQEQTI